VEGVGHHKILLHTTAYMWRTHTYDPHPPLTKYLSPLDTLLLRLADW
jgi:hypothetical protein